ncbi:MAG TPA: FG-GAP-like repeat-containing protein, partial [Pyrinomonadaceae bacterium]
GPFLVADFNNDNKPDVFAGSQSFSSSKVMLGNGAGGFASSGTLLIPVHSFADAGDFNGDGKVDLVLTGFGGTFVALVPGDGAGNFAKETFFTVPTAGPVAAADVNNDGKLDALTAGTNSVVVQLGDGAGGLGPATAFASGHDGAAISVGDVNNDGKKDVAVAGNSSGQRRGTVSVLAGDGAGAFGPPASFRVGLGSSSAVLIGDFNGDGRGDLAGSGVTSDFVVGTAPGAVTIFLGDAAGGLSAPLTFSTGPSPFAIASGDLNGDGRPDLAVTSSQNNVYVALGNSQSLFGAFTPVGVGARPIGVTLADVNNDGKLDLLSANQDFSTVSVLLGDGAGGFGAATVINSVGSSPNSVKAGDYNLDGRVDLAVTNNFGDVEILRGDGAGGFAPPTRIRLGNFAYNSAAGDFNSDGLPDLAVGFSGGIALLEGTPAGVFAPPVVVPTGASSASAVVAGDFNGDGKTDLAAAHEVTSLIAVLIGDGAGGFAAPKSYTAGTGGRSLVAADFNGDGDQDLATANIRGTVSLLAGDGAGDFAPAVSFLSGGPAPRALTTGDFDGDGSVDIAVANFGSNAGGGETLNGNVTAVLNNCDALPPALPRLSVVGVTTTLTEGDAGTTGATFNVHLSSTSTKPVTVSYYPFSQTAERGADFAGASGRIVFNPGETFKAVNVPVVGDTADEFDETFGLALALPLNAVIDGASASATILDDDPEPSLSVADVAQAEGSGATGAILFNVTLSAASGKPITVAYAAADGTAQAGADYQNASGVVTFNPGETSKAVAVNVFADSAIEADESFFLNLSNPTNAGLADAQGAATLRNDDGTVQFAAATFNATEGVEPSVFVTVARTGETSGVSIIGYATFDGTASERRDYNAALGRLRFAPGETTKTFEVVITDDRFAEGAETLTVSLSGAVGAEIGTQSSATVNINSDDAAGGPSPVKDASFDTEFFVRQHYADFLSRVPDAGGLAFWVGGIESCGADQQCREVKKIDTSAAFFLSIEFQEAGFLAYRAHKAAFGSLPNTPGVPLRLRDFLADSRRIADGVVVGAPGWPEQLEANKQAYFAELVTRAGFVALNPPTLNAVQYVNGLFARGGVLPTFAERQAAIAAFGAGGTAGRAAALRSVAESQTLKQAETNRAFVLMQYFGYLRRNPDDPQDTNFDGFNFWLTKLNQFGGNYVDAEMVKAFIQSIEYGDRFGH